MSRAALVMLGMIIGSIIGGYIPVFFGVGLLSLWSIIFNAIGGVVGIWIAFKLTEGF